MQTLLQKFFQAKALPLDIWFFHDKITYKMLRKHFYIFFEVLFIYMQMQTTLTTEMQKTWDQNPLQKLNSFS